MNANDWANNAVQKNSKWSENTVVLLIAGGILIGMGFPLAKLANDAGIPAANWIMLHSLGPCIALLPALLASRQPIKLVGRQWRFALIAGPITYAVPNLLVFLVVPNVGSGFSGILFALSPILTVAFARVFGMGSLGLKRNIGLVLGLTGAFGISLSRGTILGPNTDIWLILSLLIPILLALGNIYRSWAWPSGASPELLAIWSHFFGFLIYCSAAIFTTNELLWDYYFASPKLVLLQLFLAALTAPVVFRLQRFGGPVMLSQMGYVAAATSLFTATMFLGEHYTMMSWLFVAVIAIGVGITNIPRSVSKLLSPFGAVKKY